MCVVQVGRDECRSNDCLESGEGADELEDLAHLIGNDAATTHRLREALLDLLHSEQEYDADEAKSDGDRIGVLQVRESVDDALYRVVRLGDYKPDDVRELRDRNDHRSTSRETDEDRVRQECAELASMDEAECHADDADEDGEDGGELDLVLDHLLIGLGNAVDDALWLDDIRDEERDDRHRTNRELAGRPKDGIHDDGDGCRIEPVLWRQGGNERIRHALRDEHDSCSDACYDVIHGVRPPVVRSDGFDDGHKLERLGLGRHEVLEAFEGQGLHWLQGEGFACH